LPPTPNVEDITFEHIALNLPIIAKNALENLKEREEETPFDGYSDEGRNLLNEEAEDEQADEEIVVEQAVISEEELTEDDSEIQEDELSEDEEQDEDDNEEEEEVSEDEEQEEDDETEEYQYSKDELNDLDDESLQQILDELGLEYDADEFDREQAIDDILENQGEFDNDNEIKI